MLHSRAHGRSRGRWAKYLAGLTSSVMLVGLGVPAAAAPAAWTPPINITTAAACCLWPQAAVDGNGKSVVIWVAQSGSTYRVRTRGVSAAGVPGPVTTLSASSQDPNMFPDVAVDNAGNTVFAWLRRASSTRYLVEARTMSPAGVLGAVMNLTSPGYGAETGPLVAIDSSGTAVIDWVENNLGSGQPFKDMARTLSPSGVLSAPREIYVRDAGYWYPEMAVTPSGIAVFTWVDENSLTRARSMSPTGTLGPVQTIAPNPPDQTVTREQPEVAVDTQGSATFIWDNFNQTTGVSQIQARRLSASGTLGPLRVVASVSTETRFPQVAVTADGTATLTWIGDEASNWRIMARTLSTTNVLGRVKKVSSLNPNAWNANRDYDYLSLDGAGNATIIWDAAPGVQARTLSAAGSLSATHTFTGGGDPQVAVNQAGRAVATWDHYSQIQAAIRP